MAHRHLGAYHRARPNPRAHDRARGRGARSHHARARRQRHVSSPGCKRDRACPCARSECHVSTRARRERHVTGACGCCARHVGFAGPGTRRERACARAFGLEARHVAEAPLSQLLRFRKYYRVCGLPT